ncbi:hypothetical protein DFP72DRAFT_205006 [Ephemerocybe angulata]|uniref:Uncharacterized protein n=1 Tax=Ephemerocybe angulata TaxID=980116 RepID=A0A8H6IHC1_9AGAR|nr:hypothetical protein DFP72DRAFT_204861 [Tulosesus angulatus]KAF6765553.1 hypothetical protein DFP72DRAFT_205006 [Tulosesus angulatus]
MARDRDEYHPARCARCQACCRRRRTCSRACEAGANNQKGGGRLGQEIANVEPSAARHCQYRSTTTTPALTQHDLQATRATRKEIAYSTSSASPPTHSNDELTPKSRSTRRAGLTERQGLVVVCDEEHEWWWRTERSDVAEGVISRRRLFAGREGHQYQTTDSTRTRTTYRELERPTARTANTMAETTSKSTRAAHTTSKMAKTTRKEEVR